jgi:hypothetical protein
MLQNMKAPNQRSTQRDYNSNGLYILLYSFSLARLNDATSVLGTSILPPFSLSETDRGHGWLLAFWYPKKIPAKMS